MLENKDLILKAYEKDGGVRLYNYIYNDLSPQRLYYYMCHGEPHCYTGYDKRYEKIQNELKADAQIHFILKKEQERKQKTKEINKQNLNDNTFCK